MMYKDIETVWEGFSPGRPGICIKCGKTFVVGEVGILSDCGRTKRFGNGWKFIHVACWPPADSPNCAPEPDRAPVECKKEFNEHTQKLAAAIEAELSTITEPRRIGFLEMWKELQLEFCIAPASANIERHQCWEGGLAEHSLRVLWNARKLAAAVGLVLSPQVNDSITICALFHDLGKSNDYYTPLGEKDQWKMKRGDRYNYHKMWVKSHAQRSLYILQQYVQLESDEYLAILLHDGQYTEANRRFDTNEPDLALLIHWADLWDARHASPGLPE